MKKQLNIDKAAMCLYAVTDRSWLNGRTLEEQVEEALKGGITCLQLREKDLDEVSFIEEAKKIKRLAEAYGVPFIINDNVKVAIAVDADGVHVGQKDMAAQDVRKQIGEDKILGVSAQTVEQAIKAQEAGADYIGVGAMFTTSTKKDANATSRETLRAIRENVQVPIVAIGGINKDNIMELAGWGADGIAVVSAIFAQEHIEEATRELKALSKSMKESNFQGQEGSSEDEVARTQSHSVNRSEIKGIIFDMDGTLLDSMPTWRGIGGKLLMNNGIVPPEDIDERLKELSFIDTANYFRDDLGLAMSVEEIIAGINDLMRVAYAETVPLKKGAKDVLECLKSKGYKMCVATATDRELALIGLERLGILDYFEVVLSCGDIGHWKDEPVIYQEATKMMGLKEEEVVVVEDAGYCVKTAKEAGFKVLGIYDSEAELETEMIKGLSDYYMLELTEMEEWL